MFAVFFNAVCQTVIYKQIRTRLRNFLDKSRRISRLPRVFRTAMLYHLATPKGKARNISFLQSGKIYQDYNRLLLNYWVIVIKNL